MAIVMLQNILKLTKHQPHTIYKSPEITVTTVNHISLC